MIETTHRQTKPQTLSTAVFEVGVGAEKVFPFIQLNLIRLEFAVATAKHLFCSVCQTLPEGIVNLLASTQQYECHEILAAKSYCRIVGFEVLSQSRSQPRTPSSVAESVNNTGNSAHKPDLFGNHKTDTTH